MKLSAQYTRVSIAITIGILIVAAVIYYLAISYIARNEMDRELAEEMGELVEYVNSSHHFPRPNEFQGDVISYTPIAAIPVTKTFYDTAYFDSRAKKVVDARSIAVKINVNGTNYRLTLAESMESTQYLVQIISLITVVLAILLFGALYLTNRFILKDLWRPFYALLARLRDFSVANDIVTSDSISRVDEFNELDQVTNAMMKKARHDYRGLKAFTENASHEMMTPIAVITSKLDNLIQDDSLEASQYELLQDIYTASNKLSRLNQQLLLLVRIDNHLIRDLAPVNVEEVIREKLRLLQEIIARKEIKLETDLKPRVVTASPYLIDVLLNNLFGNAIRHNIQGGQMRITLTEKQLTVANTGVPGSLDSDKIFDRFYKSPASEGLGLGLTIAQNICESYNYILQYRFESPWHQFIVTF